jgi:hypothetical protein
MKQALHSTSRKEYLKSAKSNSSKGNSKANRNGILLVAIRQSKHLFTSSKEILHSSKTKNTSMLKSIQKNINMQSLSLSLVSYYSEIRGSLLAI